jgi:hypothetical protein
MVSAYGGGAMQPIDDATSAFLRSAADDLQRQLGIAAAVERLTIEEVTEGVALVAALRIGHRTTVIRGIGANLVAAYADLRLAFSRPVLASAFAELVDS